MCQKQKVGSGLVGIISIWWRPWKPRWCKSQSNWYWCHYVLNHHSRSNATDNFQSSIIKVSPYLQNSPPIMHSISLWVVSAKHGDARGRRYNKRIISPTLTNRPRVPKTTKNCWGQDFSFQTPIPYQFLKIVCFKNPKLILDGKNGWTMKPKGINCQMWDFLEDLF